MGSETLAGTIDAPRFVLGRLLALPVFSSRADGKREGHSLAAYLPSGRLHAIPSRMEPVL